MDTVEFFLELNSALGIGARTPKFSFYVYCIWISKFTLAVADSSKEFSTNFFILCLPANLAAYPAPPRARRLISLAQHSRPPRNATSSNSGARSSSSAVGWSHIHGACVAATPFREPTLPRVRLSPIISPPQFRVPDFSCS